MNTGHKRSLIKLAPRSASSLKGGINVSNIVPALALVEWQL